MKRKGVVAVFCLGVALATTGCGEADGPSEETLGNVAQGAICLDCDNGGGGSSGGTGGGTTPTFTGMSLSQYQQLASASVERCVGGVSWTEAMADLNHALSYQLITSEAYDWGVSNHYYPVIDRYNRIIAVCSI